MKGKHFYEFGPFRVDPGQRLLLRENQPVALQPKAFDTLLALVQNSQRVLLKEDLMKAIWPDTFVEESNLTQNIFVLRKILGETPGKRRYIVTVPGRGYRFVQEVRSIPEEEAEEEILVESHTRSRLLIEEEDEPPAPATRGRFRLMTWNVALPAAAAVLAMAAGGLWLVPRGPRFTAKDTVVLAGFANSTGDPVFDGTLRRGLAAQLEQSPFLNLLSDQRVAQTLLRMARPKDTFVTPELGREICQRSGGTAVLDGAIAQVGSRYLLTLKATECGTGETLATAASQAIDKSHVLDAMGRVASEIRSKLGESMLSVKKYDVPPENVTTASLEALDAYSLGYQAMVIKGDGNVAIPLFQRAIDLDPNIAMAYARLGTCYFNGGQAARAAEDLQKAYDLRERVSEREKFYIAAHHADIVTGDLEAARKVYELWAQIYPRDDVPLGNLGVINDFLGDYEKSLAAYRSALTLNPGSGQQVANVAKGLLRLNRLDEAKATMQAWQSSHPEAAFHAEFYTIDFLDRDVQGMEREAAAVMGEPGEDFMLFLKSDTAAYGGHFREARDLTRRAAESARRIGNHEAALAYQAAAALREALAGNLALARQEAHAALAASRDKQIVNWSASALGLAGDRAQAAQLASSLAREFPENTFVQFTCVPAIQAAAALRNDPRRALETLSVSARYELGQNALLRLVPVYLRGEAYLGTRQGVAAAAEFQKIIDHRGLVANEPIGSLAYLGLGRASALAGYTSQARSAYQEFLSLWKDADSDVPILREAKAEYTKLP
ncbi:MAG TPA: winged helix-turn-helix domain-containing protein [Bryobacteraceae bacterium]|nr:winged helix-turn-helix domain-containing protein [Bryobacteraceae bacterium]